MLLNENILSKPILEEMSREKLPEKVLCRVSYPICDNNKKNANGRVYEDAVFDRVLEEKELKEKLENRALFGHAEHPEQTQSNLEKTSHVIFEMWKDNGQVWQKFDVLDTPTGRIVDCLLRAGCRVGCSTRAEGDLEEAEDDDGTYQRVIPESYKYVTTDFTADPSTFGSIPHDIQRNVVSEVEKELKNEKLNGTERQFAQLIFEAMECQDSKCVIEGAKKMAKRVKEKKLSAKEVDDLPKQAIHVCKGCGAKFDDPADLNTSGLCKKCARRVGEKKTIENLIKEGTIKVGDKVKYGDKTAKVEKIEEGIVSLLVGAESSTAVNVNGDAAISISPEGLITILPTEILTELGQKEPKEDIITPEPEVTPIPDEAEGFANVGERKVMGPEDKIEVGSTIEIRNLQDTETVVEASPVTEVGTMIGDVDTEFHKVKTESGGDKWYEAEAYALVKIGEKLTPESIEVGATIKFAKNTDGSNIVEGKITKIEETGITIALDDGTTVAIEDPTAVNITVTKPAPAEEIVQVDAPEEEVEDVEVVEEEPVRRNEFESKIEETKMSLEELSNLSDEELIKRFKKIERIGSVGAKYFEGLDVIWKLIRKRGLEDKVEEGRLPTEGGVSDEVNVGNLLQDKEGKDWIVKEVENNGLAVTQPGEPGAEKFISWEDVDRYGFTKIGETKVVEDTRDEKARRYAKALLSGTKLNYAQVQKKVADKFDLNSGESETIVNWAKGMVGESKVKEATSVEKNGEWFVESPSGATLGGPYKSKIEADKRKKDVEFYAASKESKVEEEVEGISCPHCSSTDVRHVKGDIYECNECGVRWNEETGEHFYREHETKVEEKIVGYEPTDVDETMEILHGEWRGATIDSKADLVSLLKDMLEIAQQVKESKVDETVDIKAMYKAAKLPAPDGKGIHTKAFHELVINVAKGYVKSGDTPKQALDKAYPTAMNQLGKEKAVKKPHQKSESKTNLGESISTTAKEIKNLRVEEASTRAERDKAIELLEEIVDDTQQLKKKVKKEKAFEVKILVNKIGKTLEAKEQEVDALRAKLEEKAKLAADVKRQLEEQKNLVVKAQEQWEDVVVAATNRVNSMEESILDTKDKHQKDLSEAENKYQEKLNELTKVNETEIEKAKEEITEKVKEEVTKEFVKCFIEFKLSETNIKVDDNSQALLEKCTSLGEVEELLDEIIDAGRRSALHSESITSVHISKREVTDPETQRVERNVGIVFEGFRN